MSERIPARINKIVKIKVASLKREEEERQARENELYQERVAKGRAKVDAYYKAALKSENVPAYLLKYAVPLEAEDEYTYHDIGKFNRVIQWRIEFDVPGLSNMQFDPGDAKWLCQWASYNENYPTNLPDLSYNTAKISWDQDVEKVMVRARAEWVKYQAYLESHKIALEKLTKQSQEQERREQEAYEKRKVEEARQQAKEAHETDMLVKWLNQHPEALTLIKIFKDIADGNRSHAETVEELYDEMSWTEERWAQRAADLRREAEQAERRANDEAEERRQAEYDKENAERKLRDEKNKYRF